MGLLYRLAGIYGAQGAQIFPEGGIQINELFINQARQALNLYLKMKLKT